MTELRTPHEELNEVFSYMYLKAKETGEYQYKVEGIGTLKFELAEETEWNNQQQVK